MRVLRPYACFSPKVIMLNYRILGMNLVRTLNVITLSLLLILTGCFGLIDDEDDPIDDAEGQSTPDEDDTTTSTSPNQAPVVEGMTTSDYP